MTEYIEREVAKAVIRSYRCSTDVAIDIEKRFDDIPAADVRPVITCGECKHWVENGTDYCSCDRDALLRERDFFCAAVEKREES